MDGVGGDGDFVDAGSLGSGIDVDFCSGSGFGFVSPVVVVLDVIACDLKVAYFRPLNPNASQAVVADVVSGNVDLVQIYAIQIDPGSGVEIEMGMADEDIAVSADEMNRMAALSDKDSFEDGLQSLDQFESIGFGMGSCDFDIANGGESLVCGDIAFAAAWISGASMRSNESKGGAFAFHDNAGSSFCACDAEGACFG